MREVAGPTIPIGIDVNCGWSLDTARRILPKLEPYDILSQSNPSLPTIRNHSHNSGQQHTFQSWRMNESLFTLADAWLLANARAADIFSVYPGKHGGLSATLEIVQVAKAAGAVGSIGSNLELGIGTAAMLHAAAAMAAIDSETYPADIIGPLYHEADLLHESLALGPEVARVPEGPWIGC